VRDLDDLTGLLARGLFLRYLDEAILVAREQAQALCLLVIDLDYLKTFNDHYGHQAGDQALQGLAAMLRETLRETDLPGRYGGDEFVALLPATTPAEGVMPLPLPPLVHAILEQRLATLSPIERHLLCLSVLLDRHATLPLLCAICNLPETATRTLVARLETLRLLAALPERYALVYPQVRPLLTETTGASGYDLQRQVVRALVAHGVAGLGRHEQQTLRGNRQRARSLAPIRKVGGVSAGWLRATL
jgi:GGDEF domain-containing protein